jgi:hypothetical protein
MVVAPVDPGDDPDDQSAIYDLWEPVTLGDDQLLLPSNRIEIKPKNLLQATPGRGGLFAEWLVEASVKGIIGEKAERSVAREMAPPTLYQEGIKVQTPWLYSFVKNPDKLRYTTVLRMPQFNMSNEEAEKLANYFAAVDGTPFPYQEIPQRDPEYLEEKQREYPNYTRRPASDHPGTRPRRSAAGATRSAGVEFVAGDQRSVTPRSGPRPCRQPSASRPGCRSGCSTTRSGSPLHPHAAEHPAKGKEIFPFFGGDSQKQAVAARRLMNYLKLIEKEGESHHRSAAAAGREGEPGVMGKMTIENCQLKIANWRRMGLCASLALSVLCLFAGCPEQQMVTVTIKPVAGGAVAGASEAGEGSSEAKGYGTLLGTVTIDAVPGGYPPSPLVAQGGAGLKPEDKAVCAAEPVPDETLVVNTANKGLANVIVYLEKRPGNIKPELAKPPRTGDFRPEGMPVFSTRPRRPVRAAAPGQKRRHDSPQYAHASSASVEFNPDDQAQGPRRCFV